MSPVRREAKPGAGKIGRRRFLVQFGGALAGAAGCRWPERRLVPSAREAEGVLPGETRSYATGIEFDGAVSGYIAKSYDGRPIKLEGHPTHPSSLGGSSAFAQASLSQLYDPDRSRTILRRQDSRESHGDLAGFERFARRHFAALGAEQGKGLACLTLPDSSPTRARLLGDLRRAFPQARFYQYESWPRDRELEGSRLAFGQVVRPLYDFERTEVVLSLDADPFGLYQGSLAYARRLAHARDPDRGEPARLYVVESAWSLTGSLGDDRLALPSSVIGSLAGALDAALSPRLDPTRSAGSPQRPPELPGTQPARMHDFLTRLTLDLAEHPGRSLIVVGRQQPPLVHAIGHRLNHLLGNVGTTLRYLEEPEAERPRALESIAALAQDLLNGSIDTLVILGCNPVYDAPAELDFAHALPKARLIIHAGLYPDETAQCAHFHLPLAHPLEAWGDGRAHDGTLSLMQPLVEPLHGARSEIEILALLLEAPRMSGRELVRATHPELSGDEARWRRAVHDGFAPGTAFREQRPELRPLPMLPLPESGELELSVYPDYRVYDGRYANLALLQELPEPVSNLSWGNAALAAPETLARFGLHDGDEVRLSLGGRTLTLPVLGVPGHALGSVRVTLGHGRWQAGQVGGLVARGAKPVGANIGALRTSAAFYFAGGLEMRPTGNTIALTTTQPLFAPGVERAISAERVPVLLRELEWQTYRNQKPHADSPALPLWQPPPQARGGPRWGMAVDLTRCHGCGACVVACQVENNGTTVGPTELRRGRELAWLRIDRYFSGPRDAPRLGWQPIMCQECETAPCEQVCPVGATLHTSEGLNDMTYSRCVGTRICANNCPYKVRRFNYFGHTKTPGSKDYELYRLGLNPEVTVRSRGVMEKCTFCVQRIARAKLEARSMRRNVLDGEIQTACAQACPSGALVFGDLADLRSKVSLLVARPRAYALLGELGTRPRVRYLARVVHGRLV